MGDFSSQGHLEHLAYVVRMAIFFAKTRPFHFPISKIFACGAQKLDLAYVYGVSVAVVGGCVQYGCSAQSAVALNTNLGHIGSTREVATMQCCISEARFWQGFCAVRHAHVYNVQRVHMCMCMSYVTEV